MSINFEVDRYYINHYSDKKNIYDAIVFLQSADQKMHATVHFVPSDEQLREAIFTEDDTHAYAYYHTDFLASFIDLLRNEKPVFCRAGAITTPFFAVNTWFEEVGENE